ncbi:hypothetical protein [Saccharicrinis sp. GN24d3]|uniref:hypothetical protein n=1 Tax=Saccharicrinis sp. GN24d3 TaxID=3458416 RepID=UPI0040356102
MDKKVKDKIIFSKTLRSMLDAELSVDVPVFGLSMFPFFLPGDVIRVVKATESKLSVGDMIVFGSGNKLVAHRLIKLKQDQGIVIAKGDGLIKRDAIVNAKEVIAVAVNHYRNNQEIKWSNQRFVKKALSLLSPVLGYVFFYMARIWCKMKDSKQT